MSEYKLIENILIPTCFRHYEIARNDQDHKKYVIFIFIDSHAICFVFEVLRLNLPNDTRHIS